MTRFGLWLRNCWLNLLGCSECGRRPVVAAVSFGDGKKAKRVCADHWVLWHAGFFAPLDKDYQPPA